MTRKKNTTPGKYRPENQKRVKIDQKNNCKEKAVICPVCLRELGFEFYGHKDIYLNSSKQTKTEVGADIVVKHAHFCQDVDKGRNCWCVVEQIMVPKKNLKIKYVLNDDDHDNLPGWIRDKLDGD